MPWTLAWLVFLSVGAVSVVMAKRLDDAERRRWTKEQRERERVSDPDQT